MKTIHREYLLDLAIDWLVASVNNTIGANEPSQGVRPLVDKHNVHRIAVRQYDSVIFELDEHSDTMAVAETICTKLHRPPAYPLAAALLSNEDFDQEIVMNLDAETLAILISVAAVAAVLALVWVVRRGRSVQLPTGLELNPSSDFASLRHVAQSHVIGAEVAARLVEAVKEPWNWVLLTALLELPVSESRGLLEGYTTIGIGGVKTVRPKAGDTFDAITMTTEYPITTTDRWLVTREPSNDRVGYSVADRIVLVAHVEVCTADWWVLSNPDCPVGRLIASEPDDLIAGGRTGAVGWRAPWGFIHPEDLRVRFGFNERTLDTWRKRMVTEIQNYYFGQPDRCLAHTGLPGKIFEISTMEDPNGQPIGDAVVVEIVNRDGVPQHGLACPGGNPLLLAVVNTKPANRATP